MRWAVAIIVGLLTLTDLVDARPPQPQISAGLYELAAAMPWDVDGSGHIVRCGDSACVVAIRGGDVRCRVLMVVRPTLGFPWSRWRCPAEWNPAGQVPAVRPDQGSLEQLKGVNRA